MKPSERNDRLDGLAGQIPWGFLILALIALLLAMSGCTVGPDYRAPQAAVPARFGAATQPTTQASTQPAAPVDLSRWWTTFGDPQLDGLIDRAVANNLDLKIAEARLREARAQRGVAASGQFPVVNASGRYQRSRSSENAFSFEGAPTGGAGGGGGGTGNTFGAFQQPGDTTDLWQAGFDASWEIDVFGGVRRDVEAAEADIGAQVENRRDTLVTLLAEVARNYLELRGFQQQIEIARRNVQIQREAVEVAESKARLVGGSELDVARAQAQVASTMSTIPTLETLRDQAAHRLGVLLGLEPRALVAELSAVKAIAKGPPIVPPGLPSELLRRRPDVRRAERELAAATARVGVATADLYPRFSITAALGLQSEQFRHLGDWRSRFWNLAPGVSWNLFDAGRIRANIRVSTEQERQSLYRYEASVLTALEEVENALTAYAKEQARRQLLRDAVDRNRRAVELANTLYQGGARDFLNVIDAQRALAASEDALVQSDRLIATDLVALYKALGGGWEAAPR
jgi:NodT family efflux transporter outer membrane factor (OMF) lipoprotein